MSLPWPMCYVCRRLVRGVESHYDPVTMTHTFSAHCHGAVDVCVIPDTFFQRHPVVLTGFAFLPILDEPTEDDEDDGNN